MQSPTRRAATAASCTARTLRPAAVHSAAAAADARAPTLWPPARTQASQVTAITSAARTKQRTGVRPSRTRTQTVTGTRVQRPIGTRTAAASASASSSHNNSHNNNYHNNNSRRCIRHWLRRRHCTAATGRADWRTTRTAGTSVTTTCRSTWTRRARGPWKGARRRPGRRSRPPLTTPPTTRTRRIFTVRCIGVLYIFTDFWLNLLATLFVRVNWIEETGNLSLHLFFGLYF